MTGRKLFLHIGTEKTATTSIQEFVYLNQDKLSARGIELCSSMGVPNNQKLVACFQNHIDDYLMDHGVFDLQAKETFFQGFLDSLRAEIEAKTADGSAVFITSELFHSRMRDQECIDRLHDFLASVFDEITVICYLREQASLATSFYSTRIKAGETDSIESFVNGISIENHYFNYEIFLSKWARAFGADNIVVRIFDRSKLVSGNIFEDLLAIIDHNDSRAGFVDLPRRENASLGPIGVAIGRVINTIYPRYFKDGTSNAFRWELTGCLADSRLGTSGRLDNPRAGEIYEMFLPSNAAVARSYLESDEPLFNPPVDVAVSSPIFSSDEQMIDATTEFIESLFRTVLRDRVLSREHGILLRSATDRLFQLPAMLSAAEDILRVAQKINPEGSLIRDRLAALGAIRAVAEGK